MKLKFFGIGSAFNEHGFGDTSAYLQEGKKLLVIDSGCAVWSDRMMPVVKGKETHFLGTHPHSDHMGALANLVMYQYYCNKSPLNIYVQDPNAVDGDFKNQVRYTQMKLDMDGAKPIEYKIRPIAELGNEFESFESAQFVPTKHTKVEDVPAFGISFETPNGVVYYTGDTMETTQITDLLESGKKVSKIYVDTTQIDECKDPNIHVGVNDILRVVPKDKLKLLCAMHFSDHETRDYAKQSGMEVASISREVLKNMVTKNMQLRAQLAKSGIDKRL